LLTNHFLVRRIVNNNLVHMYQALDWLSYNLDN
jgi:hypothetical protein